MGELSGHGREVVEPVDADVGSAGSTPQVASEVPTTHQSLGPVRPRQDRGEGVQLRVADADGEAPQAGVGALSPQPAGCWRYRTRQHRCRPARGGLGPQESIGRLFRDMSWDRRGTAIVNAVNRRRGSRAASLRARLPLEGAADEQRDSGHDAHQVVQPVAAAGQHAEQLPGQTMTAAR